MVVGYYLSTNLIVFSSSLFLLHKVAVFPAGEFHFGWSSIRFRVVDFTHSAVCFLVDEAYHTPVCLLTGEWEQNNGCIKRYCTGLLETVHVVTDKPVKNLGLICCIPLYSCTDVPYPLKPSNIYGNFQSKIHATHQAKNEKACSYNERNCTFWKKLFGPF